MKFVNGKTRRGQQLGNIAVPITHIETTLCNLGASSLLLPMFVRQTFVGKQVLDQVSCLTTAACYVTLQTYSYDSREGVGFICILQLIETTVFGHCYFLIWSLDVLFSSPHFSNNRSPMPARNGNLQVEVLALRERLTICGDKGSQERGLNKPTTKKERETLLQRERGLLLEDI